MAEIRAMNPKNYSEMEREERGRRAVVEKRKDEDPDKCYKYTTTFVIYYCNFTLGIMANFLGPTLLDFRDSLGTDTPTISLIFTVVMASMLTSSMIFGIIYNYVNRHVLVILLLFTMAGSVIALPHATSLTTFFLLGGLMSASSGGWVTAQTVWVIEIWKAGAGPFIQGQHFAYAVGSMFPALIFGPFLSGNKDRRLFADAENSTDVIGGSMNMTEDAELVNQIQEHSLGVPCAISGGIIAIGAVLQLVILIALKPPAAGKREDDEETVSKNGGEKLLTNGAGRKDESEEGGGGNSGVRNVVLVLLAACLVGAWQSMEASAGQFLAPFATFAEVNLSQADAARIFFYYTIAFTLGRGLGIFAIFRISPQLILCGNFVIAALANFLLLTQGTTNVEHLWIGSILLGLGYSCAIPSVFAYVKSHIEITNFVGAFLMVFGGSLAASYPILVGKFIKELPEVLMYVSFGSMTLGLGAFLTFFCLTQRKC